MVVRLILLLHHCKNRVLMNGVSPRLWSVQLFLLPLLKNIEIKSVPIHCWQCLLCQHFLLFLLIPVTCVAHIGKKNHVLGFHYRSVDTFKGGDVLRSLFPSFLPAPTLRFHQTILFPSNVMPCPVGAMPWRIEVRYWPRKFDMPGTESKWNLLPPHSKSTTWDATRGTMSPELRHQSLLPWLRPDSCVHRKSATAASVWYQQRNLSKSKLVGTTCVQWSKIWQPFGRWKKK